MLKNRFLSLIIVTYKRNELLVNLLHHVAKQSLIPNEVIIIDNGKSLSLQKYISEIQKEFAFQIVYLPNSSNSLTVARNLGTRVAAGEYLAFVDDDMKLPLDYFEKTTQYLEENDEILGVQGRIPRKKTFFRNLIGSLIFGFTVTDKECARIKPSIYAEYPGSANTREVIFCEWLSGSNQVYSREKIVNCLWDEKMIQYSDGEDIDHSLLMSKFYNGSFAMLNNIQVTHLISMDGRHSSRKSHLMRETYAYYIFSKYYQKSFSGKIIYSWNRIANLFLILFNSIRRKDLSFYYYVYALLIVFKHRKQMRKGDLSTVNNIIAQIDS